MPAKLSLPKTKTVPSKTKGTAYKAVGRTSDGVRVLKPKAATSHLTAVGSKVARAMANTRSLKAMTGKVKVKTGKKSSTTSDKRASN